MMGVSNPTDDAFLPEIIGRKLHLRVPQYAYCILKSWVFGEFLCSSVRSPPSLSLVLPYFIQNSNFNHIVLYIIQFIPDQPPVFDPSRVDRLPLGGHSSFPFT